MTCPACQRIHDKFPAGYVTLKGDFKLKGFERPAPLYELGKKSYYYLMR